ncbi:hypothetical protein DRN98_07005 [Methanosarcinales archaeon]|nr:MAG: hypothetical protein DRN98_07005 [Methanosarcinales archaeon]
MPPWCKGKAYIPFEPRELSYLDRNIPKRDVQLDLMIGMFDTWANPHLWIDLGEDPKDHVDTSMRKISEIGSEGLYLTDFLQINEEMRVDDKIRHSGNMKPEELRNVVNLARSNGQKKIMLVVNLYDPEAPWRRYKGQGMEGTVSEKLWANRSVENWDPLMQTWKEYLKKEAKKAEDADVDYMIAVPSDFRFDKLENESYLNKIFRESADSVRSVFNGKIGWAGPIYEVDSLEDATISSFDFFAIYFDSAGDYLLRDIMSGVEENVDSVQKAVEQWLSLPQWNKLKGKEIYLVVTIPSYDGALKKGWIEPGAVYGPEYVPDYKEQAIGYEGLLRALYFGNYNMTGVISYGYWWTDRIYPDIKVLRNDLSHSIRNKDAEHVFYKWSRIFK